MSSDNEKKREFSLFPKRLGACLEPVIKPALKTQGLAGSRLITEWASIVGPVLADHCFPESLQFPAGKKNNGTLTISTENGYATHIQHVQPLILERLACYFGYQAVTRVRISHTRPRSEPPQRKPSTTKAALPKGSHQNLTQQVEDVELRETLESFAKALAGD